MLGTRFRTRPLLPLCSGRGTPWIALGSRMYRGSSLMGIRVTTSWYSPANLPFGTGTEAVRQMWSVWSARKLGILGARLLLLLLDGANMEPGG